MLSGLQNGGISKIALLVPFEQVVWPTFIKMKKKRGQFYFIAILVIISLLIGIITIKNTTQRTNIGQIGDFKDEVNTEISNVQDYALSQQLTEQSHIDLLVNFSNNYINRLNQNKDIFFVIGNSNSIKIIGYKQNETSVQYNSGNGFEEISNTGNFEQDITPTDSTIIFKLGQQDYSFELKEGQNIYYIIKHKYDEEEHIIYG